MYYCVLGFELFSLISHLELKYNQILKLSFGVYDNEEAIAMMLSLLGQGQKQQGGESKAEYDEEADQFVVKAQAICFPMLVHEIVKGLYGSPLFASRRVGEQGLDEILVISYPSHQAFVDLTSQPRSKKNFDLRNKRVKNAWIHRCPDNTILKP